MTDLHHAITAEANTYSISVLNESPLHCILLGAYTLMHEHAVPGLK